MAQNRVARKVGRPAAVLISMCAAALVAAHGRDLAPQEQQADTGELPGVRGPRVEYPAPPPEGIDIVDVFVYERPEQAAAGAERPQRFPAGTTALHLDVRLKALPPMGTEIRYEIVGPDGGVDMAEGLVSMVYLSSQAVASLDFDLRPVRGHFEDGPYRLRLFIEDAPVAVLNFSVGP